MGFLRLGRLLVTLSCAAAVVLAATVEAADAASGTPVSPAPGAQVKVTPKPGFGNGPVTLKWTAEFADCPGTDTPLHDSFPEFRRKGTANWTAVHGTVYYGPGPFSATAYVDVDQAASLQYEWRIHWQCGGYGEFLGTDGLSPVVTFTVLPLAGATQCVVPNVKGKTAADARTALTRAQCKLGKTEPGVLGDGQARTRDLADTRSRCAQAGVDGGERRREPRPQAG